MKRKQLPPLKSGQSSNKTIDEADMIDVPMKNVIIHSFKKIQIVDEY